MFRDRFRRSRRCLGHGKGFGARRIPFFLVETLITVETVTIEFTVKDGWARFRPAWLSQGQVAGLEKRPCAERFPRRLVGGDIGGEGDEGFLQELLGGELVLQHGEVESVNAGSEALVKGTPGGRLALAQFAKPFAFRGIPSMPWARNYCADATVRMQMATLTSDHEFLPRKQVAELARHFLLRRKCGTLPEAKPNPPARPRSLWWDNGRAGERRF